VQLSRGGRLSPPDLQAALDRLSVDLGQFVLRDLTLDLCRSRVMPIVSTPRSLDLAHLRTALWFHEQEVLTRFVSLDTGQVQGAREPDCRCRRGSHAVTSDPIRRLGMGGGDRPLRMASGGSRSRLGLRPANAVQVILPLQAGIVATLDSKVVVVTEQAAGRRTVFVRFGGLGWDARAQLEVLSRAGVPRLMADGRAPRPHSGHRRRADEADGRVR
jgi:hypothetical protein